MKLTHTVDHDNMKKYCLGPSRVFEIFRNGYFRSQDYRGKEYEKIYTAGDLFLPYSYDLFQ